MKKVYLLWLLYICVVLSLIFVSFFTGLLQTILVMDHSHLTLVLMMVYALAEFVSAREYFKIDKISEQLNTFKNGKNISEDSDLKEYLSKPSPTALQIFEDRLYMSPNIIDFFSERIVWLGIFATIIGVILSFWPFLNAGMSVDAIKANLSVFFSGVAVAFIPTAVSFVFKIALDTSSEILSRAIARIVSETTLLVSP